MKPETGPGREAVAFGMDKINGNRATMDNLSDLLSGVLRTPLVDQTGLTEKYTFELKVPQSTSPSGQYDAGAIISSLRDIGPTVVSTTVTQQYLAADTAEYVPSAN